MIHPMLHLLASRPDLVVEHAEAYVELVGEEFAKTVAMWKMRMVLRLLGAGLVALGAVFAGVALMLWGATPPAQMHAPWALLAAPIVPLAAAALCLVLAGRPVELKAFDKVKEQMRADLGMLREVRAA